MANYFTKIIPLVCHFRSGKSTDGSQGVIKMGADVFFKAYIIGGVTYAKQDNTFG
jgi:hypothetical protein